MIISITRLLLKITIYSCISLGFMVSDPRIIRKSAHSVRAFFNYITGGTIAPRGIGFVAIILPPENLVTWFPNNTSKGTKVLKVLLEYYP